MDGFFVTVNCSKIFDSSETFYKIFIRKNEMSIVYELVEWIRFMFGLEGCFFLIHENSVIHELEDINVLEILNSLEIRPCHRSNCIHKKMEKNLFHKLNLFTYWDEMKVHKLFQARCNYIIQKVSNNHYLNIKDKPDYFPLQSGSNFFEESDNSVLANDPNTIVSPLKLTQKLQDDRSQVLDTATEDVPNKYQQDLKKANALFDNKNTNSDEINMPKEFSSKNSESLTYFKSKNLNLLAENSALSSFGNKKQNREFTSQKFKKIGIPFSLGAVLSNIREEQQNEEFEKEQELGQMKKSFDSVHGNTENETLHAENAHMNPNKDLLKRKRKRKHKKQNLQIDSDYPASNLSWDYFEPSVIAKPNHIRFNDNYEMMETETTENTEKNCKSLPKEQESCTEDYFKDVNQQMATSHVTAKSTSLVEKNENNENCLAENEICENEIDSNNEKLNNDSQTYGTEKKKLDDSQQNVPDLESLKQKIKHSKICFRFY